MGIFQLFVFYLLFAEIRHVAAVAAATNMTTITNNLCSVVFNNETQNEFL